MLHRSENFHGGRAYAPDSPDKRERGVENRASLILAWIKLQVSRLSPGLPRKMGEGFSLLGFDELHEEDRELDTEVFPLAHRRKNVAKDFGQVRSRE